MTDTPPQLPQQFRHIKLDNLYCPTYSRFVHLVYSSAASQTEVAEYEHIRLDVKKNNPHQYVAFVNILLLALASGHATPDAVHSQFIAHLMGVQTAPTERLTA